MTFAGKQRPNDSQDGGYYSPSELSDMPCCEEQVADSKKKNDKLVPFKRQSAQLSDLMTGGKQSLGKDTIDSNFGKSTNELLSDRGGPGFNRIPQGKKPIEQEEGPDRLFKALEYKHVDHAPIEVKKKAPLPPKEPPKPAPDVRGGK